MSEGKDSMTYVNQETESNDPSNEQEKVHGPVDEGTRKWKQPEQGKQYRQACNNFSVDEALSVPGALAPGVVEIFAGQTSNDGCEGKLGLVSRSSLGQLDEQNSPRRCGEACQ
jgi:hypothetical protein